MSRHLWRSCLLLSFVATLGLAILLATPTLLGKVVASAMQADAHHHPPMSEEEMRRWVEDWFSKHPQVGRSSVATAVADTFFASGFQFNGDGNTSTQVDTAKIMVGDAVLWRWVSGLHTVTNGTGPADPQAGSMFNVPHDGANPSFQFTFDNAGTVPFFCSPHASFNMRGVVVVRSVVGVGPADGVALGFTAGPAPNPSHGVIRFRFALREEGPVRAEVLDVRGRRVATVLDQDFGAGAYAATWNGRDERGSSAGVYYLRLRVPGYTGTRRFVVTR